jgi:aromatic-L-amino-acid/L-tryptophan decarboxylase
MADPAHSPFELDSDRIKALGARITALAAEHLTGMRGRAVFGPMRAEVRRALIEQPLPRQGLAPDLILERIATELMPYPMGNGHPRFFGWVNSPPAHLAALTEMLAAALNASCAGGDHAAVYLEHGVVGWLMDLVDFPRDGSYGLLVSGGSMASLTALAAARHAAARADGWDLRACGLQGDRRYLTLYASSESHGCIRKSVELLGLGSDSIRTVPVDAGFRMDAAALRTAIEADKSAGHRPFCVVASAGTVNTGAIDPIDAIAALCSEHHLWLHVDGAYGAVGILDPEATPLYRGMARADSIALDPHKWLSVPVECGAVLVRDGDALRETFSLVPPYLRTEPDKGFGGLPWFSEFGFQQTRGFRALKLWVTMLTLGREGLAEHVMRQRALAKRLAHAVEDADDLELAAPVTLSVVCLRYVPRGWRQTRAGDTAALDSLNKAIVETIQEEGEAFVTHTLMNGQLAIRACVLHYATTAADIDFLVALIRRVGERLCQTNGTRERGANDRGTLGESTIL